MKTSVSMIFVIPGLPGTVRWAPVVTNSRIWAAGKLGRWSIVDRYVKFATENLAFAASRIEQGREGANVMELSRFCHGQKNKRVSA